MRVTVRLQYWVKIVQYWLFVHLNYSVLHAQYTLWVLCVWVFLNLGSFKCFGVKCGIYFAEQIYMGGLGLFFTHELPLCCDHDYYCFCPSHSKFPVGCGFHMLKASWRHLNVLYFNSYSLLIVICWCICDISRYPFSF